MPPSPSRQPTPTSPIQQIPGALTMGDPAINDGGVRFNFNQYQWTHWGLQLAVQLPLTFTETAWTAGSGAGASLSCWVQYIPSSETQNDIPAGSAVFPTTDGYFFLLGDFFHSFGGGSSGSRLSITPATGVLVWNNAVSNPVWTSGVGLMRAPLVPLRYDARQERQHLHPHDLFERQRRHHADGHLVGS